MLRYLIVDKPHYAVNQIFSSHYFIYDKVLCISYRIILKFKLCGSDNNLKFWEHIEMSGVLKLTSLEKVGKVVPIKLVYFILV